MSCEWCQKAGGTFDLGCLDCCGRYLSSLPTRKMAISTAEHIASARKEHTAEAMIAAMDKYRKERSV